MDQKDKSSALQQEQSLTHHAGDLWQMMAQGPARSWLWLIVCLSMTVFTWHACTRMVAAGDTWVAMACGRHFINHGVDTVEPFSANSHHAGPTEEEVAQWPKWAQKITQTVGLETVKKWHPTGWVNQNWLTHVIFYWLTTTMGSEEEPFFNALVYWKFGIYILSVLAIFAMGRQLGLHPLNAAIAASLALFIGRSFLDVRPAGFSNLLVPTLILIWVLATYRNILWIWLMVPLAVFWSNVHGGYIYVFIVMIPFIGLHLLATLPRRWSIWLYHALGWTVLFLIGSKGLMIEGLDKPEIFSSKILLVILLTAAGGLAVTWRRQLSDGTVIAYHIVASVIIFFLVMFGHLSPDVPDNILPRQWDAINKSLGSLRTQFFVLYLAFVALGLIFALWKDNLVALKPRQVGHLIGAYLVTLVAAIVFNPFHLTNLTHTFIISVSKHAERWRMVHEWHPAFEWDNPVGTAVPFLLMFIVALIAAISWALVHLLTTKTVKAIKTSTKQEEVSWPKLDLPLVIVAALTIYMAIRSRRFIPIAAFAACPVIALLLEQTVKSLRTYLLIRMPGFSLSKLKMPGVVPFIGLASWTLVVVIFGSYVACKYYRVYIKTWPQDPDYYSVFMRMTASHLKPFEACQFIRDNKLSGNMLNYWTEGGFIAYGQTPDPNTGKTPLQLFMDGRAQAAYDRKTFDLWSSIWAGVPGMSPQKAYQLQVKKNKTQKDYQVMGRAVVKALRKHDVWVALVPKLQFDSSFARALGSQADWPVVYIDDKQKLFVDIRTEQGNRLFQGIASGQTLYPNEYTRLMNQSFHKLTYMRNSVEERRKGLELGIQGFHMKPCDISAILLLNRAARYSDLKQQVAKFALDYVEDLTEHRDEYREQNGYGGYLEAGWRICGFLTQYYAQIKQKPEEVQVIQDQANDYIEELKTLSAERRW